MMTSQTLLHLRVLAILTLVLSNHGFAANLWPGEEIIESRGFPFIAKFSGTQKGAPLVVFIPGAFSLARIAYGGHEDSHSRDFLAYWANQAGYNFLGISYPLVTPSNTFDKAYPHFTVRDWGYGSAEVTQAIIEKEGLSGKVIVLVWSMAGKSVQPYAEAAAKLGFDLDFHVSLAATPPLPTTKTMTGVLKMHPSGHRLWNVRAPAAIAGLAVNAKQNGRDVLIPEEVLLTQYLGHPPVQLSGHGIRYDAQLHAHYRDHWADMQDTKFYALNYPFVAAIIPGQADPRHAITDSATWGYINTNKIFHDVLGGESQARELTESNFKRLKDLTSNAPQSLAIDVDGNHFFFVGEKGAKQTIKAVKTLEKRVGELKHDLNVLINTN